MPAMCGHTGMTQLETDVVDVVVVGGGFGNGTSSFAGCSVVLVWLVNGRVVVVGWYW